MPDYGELIPIEKFISWIKFGAFIDYDGSGYYATSTEYFQDLPAIPSEMLKGKIFSSPSITHIAWFNK